MGWSFERVFKFVKMSTFDEIGHIEAEFRADTANQNGVSRKEKQACKGQLFYVKGCNRHFILHNHHSDRYLEPCKAV